MWSQDRQTDIYISKIYSLGVQHLVSFTAWLILKNFNNQTILEISYLPYISHKRPGPSLVLLPCGYVFKAYCQTPFAPLSPKMPI